MAWAVFDPASLTTNGTTFFTLSGGNLVATGNNYNSPVTVKTSTSYSSGKYYWECTHGTGNTGDGYSQVGVCNSTAANNATTGGAEYLGDGRIYWSGGLFTSSMPSLGTNAVVRVAVDIGAALIWFSVNGGTWNVSGTANPATGVGGISIATLTLPLKAFVSQGGNGGTPDVWTLNAGQSGMTYTVPAGFTSGLGSPPPVLELPWLNPVASQKRLTDFLSDEELNDAHSIALQRQMRHPQIWGGAIISGAYVQGVAVAKLLDYAVLAPPVAVNVAKLIEYTVLAPPTAVNVSKLVSYAVLLSLPTPSTMPPNMRRMIQGIDTIDADETELAPNLNLRRRLLTPASSYFLQPPPLVITPPQAPRDLGYHEDIPVNLNLATRRVVPPGALLAGVVSASQPQRPRVDPDDAFDLRALSRRYTPPADAQPGPRVRYDLLHYDDDTFNLLSLVQQRSPPIIFIPPAPPRLPDLTRDDEDTFDLRRLTRQTFAMPAPPGMMFAPVAIMA